MSAGPDHSNADAKAQGSPALTMGDATIEADTKGGADGKGIEVPELGMARRLADDLLEYLPAGVENR